MAGLGAKDILRNITALEQLIEEINFQRAKEMRQCLMSKDSDTGFVMVHGTTYWTDLFVRHFLFQTDRSTDADDLLFFIRKKQMKGSRYIPKYQTEVEVYRKDSRKLPIGDPDIDWEETVYLNLIIHQFDYTLTLAVCTRTSPKELQVLRRHSQKVYASPSRRRMDTKGEVEEITYPNVCFHVDNFDEVFADMLVRDGEMVCVELVASDHAGTRQAVIFLGSIRYDALKRVYDARASLSSKVAQRMMMGLFSGSNSQRIEFVRMKGPQGKGHAEMAVTKPKGSGVETPTSEPGLSLTDLWDPDWEDEPEDRFFYIHQRRLSDPSANFNTFINSGWVTRAEGKSRSENEGLDNFANGLYEIESGDVRDATSSCRCCSVVACRRYEDEESGIEFFQGMCEKCEHFHGNQELLNGTKPFNTSQHELVTEETILNCTDKKLSSKKKFDHRSKTLLQEFGNFKDGHFNGRRESVNDEFEVVEAVEASEDMENTFCGESLTRKNSLKEQEIDIISQHNLVEPDILERVENITMSYDLDQFDSNNFSKFNVSNNEAALTTDKDECAFLGIDNLDLPKPDESFSISHGKLVSPDESFSISHGKLVSSDESFSISHGKLVSPDESFSQSQDRPVSPDESDPFLIPEVSYRPKDNYDINYIKKDILTLNKSSNIPSTSKKNSMWHSFKKAKTNPGSAVRVRSNPDLSYEKIQLKDYIPLPITEFNKSDAQAETLLRSRIPDISDFTKIDSIDTGQNVNIKRVKRTYSSGPVYYRRLSFDMRKIEKTHLIDGEREKLTKSKSWDCVRGLPQKKSYKRDASVPFRVTKDGTKVYFLCDLKLDDGAYNPLWTTKGFTQTFHFWKETRRAQSVPLNAYLTYVTLPWFTIITDILDHRTGPILTF